jgi:hypothetical protein
MLVKVSEPGLSEAGLPESRVSELSGALFDPTGQYRYTLWRCWQPQGKRVAFVMLNPSTADAESNDPTIRRCIGFAQSWGYGALEVVNLFSFRTPHPSQLALVADPVGADCDAAILRAVERADCTVIAWGNWGVLHGRAAAVLALIKQPHCLGCNQSGQPRHPLYLRRESQPLPYPTRLD